MGAQELAIQIKLGKRASSRRHSFLSVPDTEGIGVMTCGCADVPTEHRCASIDCHTRTPMPEG
jgi:hypothetical protein